MLQAQHQSAQSTEPLSPIEEKFKQARALVDQYDQLSNNDQSIDAHEWLKNLNQHAESFLAPPPVEIISAQDFVRAAARFHYAVGSCALEVENLDLAEKSIFQSLRYAKKMDAGSTETQHLLYLGENALASVLIRGKKTSDISAGLCSRLEDWTKSANCSDSERAAAMLNLYLLKEREKRGSADSNLLEDAHRLLALSTDAQFLSAYADASYRLGILSLAQNTLEGANRAALRFHECHETVALAKHKNEKFRTKSGLMLCIALSRAEKHAEVIKIAPGFLNTLRVEPGQNESEYPYARIVVGTLLGAALALTEQIDRAREVLREVGWFEKSLVGEKAGVSSRSVLQEVWSWRESHEMSARQHLLVPLLKNS